MSWTRLDHKPDDKCPYDRERQREEVDVQTEAETGVME